jgi:hypothetical protein
MDYQLNRLLVTFIPIIIVGVILTFSKGKIVDTFSKATIIYATLMLWTLYGFIYFLDNTMAWGCMGAKNDALSLGYVIFNNVEPYDNIIYIDFNNIA